MTRTISFAESTAGLALDPVFRASPLVLTGAPISGVTLYRAQLWRRPQDAREADAEAIATAYGTVATSVVTVAFSGTQMDVTLAADGGRYDDIWLTLACVQGDGQLVVINADWLRVNESGADPAAFVIDGIEVTVDEETNTGQFTVGGITYTMPLVPESTISPGTSGWVVSIVNGTVIFTKDGVSYSAQVVEE